MWSRFWNWYDTQFTKNLIIVAIIVYLQIPHMWWAADVYLELGTISRINPVTDFLLYGVDLLEILLMLKVGMMIYGRIRKTSN